MDRGRSPARDRAGGGTVAASAVPRALVYSKLIADEDNDCRVGITASFRTASVIAEWIALAEKQAKAASTKEEE